MRALPRIRARRRNLYNCGRDAASNTIMADAEMRAISRAVDAARVAAYRAHHSREIGTHRPQLPNRNTANPLISPRVSPRLPPHPAPDEK